MEGEREGEREKRGIGEREEREREKRGRERREGERKRGRKKERDHIAIARVVQLPSAMSRVIRISPLECLLCIDHLDNIL